MKYFTLRELTRTGTGIPNEPTAEVIEALTALVDKLLDPLRTDLGMALRVTSGYRSPAVNAAVKGAKNSQHMKGEAVDFTCTDNARAFHYIKDHMTFDQLIWEKGTDKQPAWIHVSYNRHGHNRMQVLRIR